MANRSFNVSFILRRIIAKLPQRKIIVFESKPAFSDNTFAVYQELKRRSYDKKYQFIWFIDDDAEYNYSSEDVRCINIKKNYFGKFLKLYFLEAASFIISCNAKLYSLRKNHHSLHLTHGSPIKDTKDYMFLNENVDKLVVQAPFFKEIAKKAWNVSYEKMLFLGMPRSDYLLYPRDNVKNKIGFLDYDRMIIWLPTYRSSKLHSGVIPQKTMPFYLPIIESRDDLKTLDNILRKYNSLLCVKIHFAQEGNAIIPDDYNHIVFIDNTYLLSKDVQLYELLSLSDALITDYSSVYYEYLLTKRPIGLTVDDIKEYEKGWGFALDYFENIKGEYLSSFEELIEFIESVCKGTIKWNNEWNTITDRYNVFFDGKSSERVVDYLEKDMGL